MWQAELVMKSYSEFGRQRSYNHKYDHGAYLPSEEEIRDRVASIRKGWDKKTERQRRVMKTRFHDFTEVAEFDLSSQYNRWDYV